MNPSDFDPFSELLTTLADYYGRKLAPATIQLYWNALAGHDFETVKALCTEHVKTQKFMPAISEILDALRTMDGRPNAEEAWATVAKSLNDEGLTVVWTEEMASAFGVALGLQDDRVAARMAFKEAYEEAVREARSAGAPAKWIASLGHDPAGREGPLIEAVRRRRLSVDHVRGLLPYRIVSEESLKLLEKLRYDVVKA
jgi:hypothetical protein